VPPQAIVDGIEWAEERIAAGDRPGPRCLELLSFLRALVDLDRYLSDGQVIDRVAVAMLGHSIVLAAAGDEVRDDA
jgi:hypothetical protein